MRWNKRPSLTTGERYGRLVALEMVDRDANKKVRWRFRCDCGGEIVARVTSVRAGDVKGCGCLSTSPREGWRKPGVGRGGRPKHGLSGTPEYNTWVGIRRRCYDPSVFGYSYYGGRGIVVCDRWTGDRGFENFLVDMGQRPSPAHSIDRIDSDGNYCPENCRWATKAQQIQNRRNSRRDRPPRNRDIKAPPRGRLWVLVHEGRAMSLQQIAETTGMDPKLLESRLRSGESLSCILSQP